jgi:hypothetical protein
VAQEAISNFFRRLDFRLNNDRNSWGAVSGDAVLLRTWSDEFTRAGRRVIVLKDYRRPGGTTSVGQHSRAERMTALAWGRRASRLRDAKNGAPIQIGKDGSFH